MTKIHEHLISHTSNNTEDEKQKNEHPTPPRTNKGNTGRSFSFYSVRSGGYTHRRNHTESQPSTLNPPLILLISGFIPRANIKLSSNPFLRTQPAHTLRFYAAATPHPPFLPEWRDPHLILLMEPVTEFSRLSPHRSRPCGTVPNAACLYSTPWSVGRRH